MVDVHVGAPVVKRPAELGPSVAAADCWSPVFEEEGVEGVADGLGGERVELGAHRVAGEPVDEREVVVTCVLEEVGGDFLHGAEEAKRGRRF